MAQYFNILEKYEGVTVVRKIMELDGLDSANGIDFEINSCYKDKPDPVRAFGGDYTGNGRSMGQAAIAQWYEKHGRPLIIRQSIMPVSHKEHEPGPGYCPPSLSAE